MSRSATDPETGLTPKMETFAVELARTGNASEAYRRAYNAENMKPETVSRRAAELAADGKIAARLSVLRSDIRVRSGITLTDHLETLRQLRQEARSSMQYAAAISAEVSRGKVSGLYEGTTEEDTPPPRRIVVEIVDGRKA